MGERTLVCAVIREKYIGLRTVSRSRRSPHRFYIPRYSLEELGYTSDNIIVHDIRSFAVLRRTVPGNVEIEFTWLGDARGNNVCGYQEIVTLPYDGLMEGLRESVRQGGPISWSALAIDNTPKCPQLVFNSRRNLKDVLENGIVRRKLVRALRDHFQWPGSECIEFYDDFEPYSFGFREIRNGEPGIVGGLILYGQENMQDAYYSMHT